MESLRRFWFIVLFNLSLAWPAFSAERVAIVFGNNNYLHAAKLKNPINDAGAVAEMLETKLGFTLVKPPKKRSLVSRFSRQEAIWKDIDLDRFYSGIEAFK